MRRELRVHSVPTRVEVARTLIEIVAILAAGVWAIYTFVYEQRIKPLSEPPAFAVPTEVEQGPTINGVTFLTVHKRVENTGDVPIDLAAETLTVYGETLASHSETLQNFDTSAHKELSNDVPRRAAKVLFTFAKLRRGAVGGDQATAFVLPPRATSGEDFLIAVPRKTFPIVLITRKDFVGKAPISPKIAVTIVQNALHGYDLRSSDTDGEYDNKLEYPLKP